MLRLWVVSAINNAMMSMVVGLLVLRLSVKLVDPTALNASAGPSVKVVAQAPMRKILADPSAMRVQEDQVPLY